MADAGSLRSLDLGDFDAVGVATAVVEALRAHAILGGVDAIATISAPEGWHPVVVAARAGGHVVVRVRYPALTASRRHNVAGALERRGWRPDEDADGATRTFPPGSEPVDAAFELLTALTVAGAPAGVRTVTAVDSLGAPVRIGDGPA